MRMASRKPTAKEIRRDADRLLRQQRGKNAKGKKESQGRFHTVLDFNF
jgi:hypothetical protein